MAEIVLTTFNAKYIHAAFGLRYLLANLGPLQPRARLVEFDLQQRPADIVEALLGLRPRIIGIGVYIWNASLSYDVVALLKRVAPEVIVVLGGPEVSYETEDQLIVQAADYVIAGEADLHFADLCGQLLGGARPAARVQEAALPDLARLRLPYHLYDRDDRENRIVYVEASRGCPFSCEFCLSSLDIPVRQFPLEPLLEALNGLLEQGVRQFKFVDRTFNLNLHTSQAILDFFAARYRPGLFLHFELIPDRLPESLRAGIARFPQGALQFEVGIQTFNAEVAARIKRRQDYGRLADNLRFLRQHTGVHIHADLIAGLPGESLESFGHGLDELVRLQPHEIQVGMLKRLRGTPIVRHDHEWQMIYSPQPPYELLQNRLISFSDMQRLRRFSRYWDLVVNSGNFVQAAPLLWEKSQSPFRSFMQWSDWLRAQLGRNHSIALVTLAELLFRYLTEQLAHDPGQTAAALWSDYQRGGRSDKPPFLRPFVPETAAPPGTRRRAATLKRQARHLGWVEPGAKPRTPDELRQSGPEGLMPD